MDKTVERLEALIRDMAPSAQAGLEVLIEETARRGLGLAIMLWCLAAMMAAVAAIWCAYTGRMVQRAIEIDNYKADPAEWQTARWVVTGVLFIVCVCFAGFGVDAFLDYLAPSRAVFEMAIR